MREVLGGMKTCIWFEIISAADSANSFHDYSREGTLCCIFQASVKKFITLEINSLKTSSNITITLERYRIIKLPRQFYTSGTSHIIHNLIVNKTARKLEK